MWESSVFVLTDIHPLRIRTNFDHFNVDAVVSIQFIKRGRNP